MATATLKSQAVNIMAAEKKGCEDLLAAAQAFDAQIADIVATLDYPANFRSEVTRLAGSLRSSLSYMISSELPTVIQTYTPAPTE